MNFVFSRIFCRASVHSQSPELEASFLLYPPASQRLYEDPTSLAWGTHLRGGQTDFLLLLPVLLFAQAPQLTHQGGGGPSYQLFLFDLAANSGPQVD